MCLSVWLIINLGPSCRSEISSTSSGEVIEMIVGLERALFADEISKPGRTEFDVPGGVPR